MQAWKPLVWVVAVGAFASSARAAAPAPEVAQFAAPQRFWCLKAHPGQAQVTVGWSVPSATAVTVLLDGRVLRQGLRDRLPFAVLAGKADGIGATIVFRCNAGTRHRITLRWQAGDSAPATRTITIREARG